MAYGIDITIPQYFLTGSRNILGSRVNHAKIAFPKRCAFFISNLKMKRSTDMFC